MKPHLLGYASVLAAVSALGCGGEASQAVPPASPPVTARSGPRMGVMEQQGTSTDEARAPDEIAAGGRSPVTCAAGANAAMTVAPRGALLGVRPDGTAVPAEAIAMRTGMIRVPVDAIMTSSAEASAIDAFPEEAQSAQGDGRTVEATVAAHGMRRRYASGLSYEGTVGFFDRSLGTYGFETWHRVTAGPATVWLARCPGGETVHVIVRQTTPPQIEVVEAAVQR